MLVEYYRFRKSLYPLKNISGFYPINLNFYYFCPHRERILHHNGVINVLSNNNYEYQFFIKDHLGNTRVVCKPDFNSNGTLKDKPNELQRSDYYPFGMLHGGITTQPHNKTENHYLYNGKEMQYEQWQTAGCNITSSLHWYDYGARFYDAQLGRFMGVDPITEDFCWVSPYNYAENRPIDGIDLWGLQYVSINPNTHTGSGRKLSENTRGLVVPYNISTANGNSQNYLNNFIGALQQATYDDKIGDGIKFLAVLAHHGSKYGNIWPETSASRLEVESLIPSLATALQDGTVKFDDNAVIFVNACNFGTNSDDPLEQGASYADALLAVLTANGVKNPTVIAMVDDGVSNGGTEKFQNSYYVAKKGKGTFHYFTSNGIEDSKKKKMHLSLNAQRIISVCP